MSNLLPSNLLPSSADLPDPLDSTLNGMTHADVPTPPPVHPDTGRDPYRAVVLLLLAASILGIVVAFVAAQLLGNPVLFNVAITFGIAAGILIGIAVTRELRATQPDADGEGKPAAQAAVEAVTPVSPPSIGWRVRVAKFWIRIEGRLRELGAIRIISLATAAAGVFALGLDLLYSTGLSAPAPLAAVIGAAISLAAAGLSAAAAHYLQAVDSRRFRESPGLCRGSRVVAWILVVSALSIGLASAGFYSSVQVLRYALIVINFAACYGLFWAKPINDDGVRTLPLEMDVLSILGSRPNIIASILDNAEWQLGIDLRSTWALTVVRRGIEPLAIGLCLLAWLSTSLTVVGMQEEGLIERLGVAERQLLQPGLQLHWPWPIDRVFRIPVRRIQTTTVGHEARTGGGPENVLWAFEHAANEYTLLLGNGRDLITVDATVQYRIADARAWRYHSQNPADAIRAIAYRAVMRSTVNRTLSEALSENVVVLTSRMREMVQQDADALGLGVQIVAFTVSGMHPPVAVASDYQAVVSAEIAKVTAVVNAHAYHNEIVPAAEASVLKRENTARADGIKTLAQAMGEAWSFRTVEYQFRAAPQEYIFRRRLETLENGLSGLQFTVVDSRFQRDGGELWLIP